MIRVENKLQPQKPLSSLVDKVVYLGFGYYIRKTLDQRIHVVVGTLFFYLTYPFSFVIGCVFTVWGMFARKKIFKKKKRNFLAIVAIAKGEEDYIEEWLDFHKYIGVDKVYLYDNSEDNNQKDKCLPYIKSGFCEWVNFPGIGMQLHSYNDAICRFGSDCRYMAFIDCDEFLLPLDGKSIHVIDDIMSCNTNAGGVAINWCMFGSGGQETKTAGGVLERFLMRGTVEKQGNECVKTIVMPECVKNYGRSHYPHYKPGFYNVDANNRLVPEWFNPILEWKSFRINHYFTKSKEEWIVRRARGTVDHGPNKQRTLDEFYAHNHNDVYDNIAFKIITSFYKRTV